MNQDFRVKNGGEVGAAAISQAAFQWTARTVRKQRSASLPPKVDKVD